MYGNVMIEMSQQKATPKSPVPGKLCSLCTRGQFVANWRLYS